MKSITLQEIIEKYDALDYDLMSISNIDCQSEDFNLPDSSERWKKVFKYYQRNRSSIVRTLAEEYMTHGDFRNPILYSHDEESGVFCIENGYARLTALKTLIESKRINIEDTIVRVQEWNNNEQESLKDSAFHIHNIFVNFPNSYFSYFGVKFSLDVPKGLMYSRNQILSDAEDSLFELLNSFKVNEESWASLVTGGFDIESGKGTLLFTIDLAHDKKHLFEQAQSKIAYYLECLQKVMFSEFNVILDFSFEESRDIFDFEE